MLNVGHFVVSKLYFNKYKPKATSFPIHNKEAKGAKRTQLWENITAQICSLGKPKKTALNFMTYLLS